MNKGAFYIKTDMQYKDSRKRDGRGIYALLTLEV